MKNNYKFIIAVLTLLFNYSFAQTPVSALDEDFQTWPAPGWKTYQFGPAVTEPGGWVQNKWGKGQEIPKDHYLTHRFDKNDIYHNSWLVSPPIAVTTDNYKLIFDAYVQSLGVPGHPKHSTIMVAEGINNGVPTSTNGSFQKKYEFTSTNGWFEPFMIDLIGYAGKTIYIGFQLENLQDDIDAISIVSFSLDKVSFAPSTAYANAALTSIVSPTGFNPATGSQNIVVSVKNMGTQVLSGYTMSWKVDGVIKTAPATVPSIAAGATANVTLGTHNFTDGNHTIEATVNAAGDLNLTNNSKQGTYSVGTSSIVAVKDVWPRGSGVSAVSQPVIVNIHNQGTQTLSPPFDVQWSVNGVAQSPWTESAISIAPGEAKNIQVGTFAFDNQNLRYMIDVNLIAPYNLNQANNKKTVYYNASSSGEDFNHPTNLPFNWSKQTDGINSDVLPAHTSAQLGDFDNYYLGIFGQVADPAAIAWGPTMNVTAGDVLKIKTKPDDKNPGTATIVYRTSPTSTPIFIATLPNPFLTVSYWKAHQVNIGTLPATVQLGLKCSGPSGFKSVSFDDFYSTASYAFPVIPGKLAAGSITPTGAALTWLASPAATGYSIQYRVAETSTWTPATATTNSYTMAGLTANTNYEVQVKANNSFGSSEYAASVIFKTTTVSTGLTLNLTAFIQGFFKTPSSNVMTWLYPQTLTVELRSSPTVIVATATGTLSTAGLCQLNFTAGATGVPYYIVVRHKNALTTWSSTMVTFPSSTSTVDYDFTTADTKAYSNSLPYKPMKLVGTKWCFYSGDVNQSGVIESADYSKVFTDGGTFKTGNLDSDVTGEGTVESADVSLVYINAGLFLQSQKP